MAESESGATQRRRYPLQLQISALFVALILLLSLALGWLGYSHISRLILEDTEQLFERLPDAMSRAFDLRYRPVNAAIAVLANGALEDAVDLQQRLNYVDVMIEVIDLEPQVSGFQVGYPNGDYFIVRPLLTDRQRAVFDAPANARYMMDHIGNGSAGAGKEQQRQFLDATRRILADLDLGATEYDPRTRPWYLDAVGSPEATDQVTAPYRFFFLQEYGVTLSRRAQRGQAVLAVDITLGAMSATLAANPVSASSFSFLINEERDVLGHAGLSQIAHFEQIVNLDSVDHPLVNALLEAGSQQQGIVRFEHSGQSWFGGAVAMEIAADAPLTLLVAAPEVELFASALSMRRNSVLATLLLIAAALPLVWLVAGRIAKPLRRLSDDAAAIADLDFRERDPVRSPVSEVDDLSSAMSVMRATVSNFLSLINSLSGDPDIDHLLRTVTEETMTASGADAAIAYLLDEPGTTLLPCANSVREDTLRKVIQPVPLDVSDATQPLVQQFEAGEVAQMQATRDDPRHPALAGLCQLYDADQLNLVMLPLLDRGGQRQGVLFLVFQQALAVSEARIGFATALSGFAAVSMESGRLLEMQKQLLQSFIEVIAGSIDAKSPYTGGHCQRVPELTQMLARAACEKQSGPLATFDLDEDQWEALRIGAWLHDCGKVTTPEYVVDKSTKLETLNDRIHEIRTRFEVLKRDAEIDYWRDLAEGGQAEELQRRLNARWLQLDDDFAFVAQCNLGAEFMADESIERLQGIAAQVWQRTIDDRLGVSWEEAQRKSRSVPAQLPVDEPLLADRPDHIIERSASEHMPADNPWGFRIDVPEHKYNRGELYNLSVRRGTLSEEERFTINDHMVQTIVMLDQLPFKGHLAPVPEIAGGHHEKMDGTGYPKRLKREQMSLPARMMAIADIFEALTASDRPYKKAKGIAESIDIMARMVDEDHVDPDLFRLFLESGVYLDYARQFLQPEQIEPVDLQRYLQADG